MHLAVNSFSREVSQFFDAYFESYNLATSYIELLLLVHKHEKITQKEIAEEMNLAPSTITRFIKKLEKKGLTDKEKDGRAALIVLSADGRKMISEFSERYEKAISDLKNKLGEKFVDTTEQLLKHGTESIKAE
jgi:DNA-binding MarR family transcriptional regulator